MTSVRRLAKLISLISVVMVLGLPSRARASCRLGGPTEDLYAVEALDDGLEVWAVGAFGSVFHSTDSGSSWVEQETPVLEPLFDVSFVDNHRGVVVGKSGVVLRTVDGGESWVRGLNENRGHLFGVAMVDRRRGWAVGDWGVILETNDGGATWSDKSIDEDVVLSATSFVDVDHGWIVGEFGTVMATSDGGVTWQKQDSGTEKTLFGVSFVSAASGWAVGLDGIILHTRDGGKTWVHQRGSNGARALDDLDFVDILRDPALYDVAIAGRNGYIVGDMGTVQTTTDGGETWHRYDVDERARLLWLRGITATAAGFSLAVGAKGLAIPMAAVEQPRRGDEHNHVIHADR